MTSIQNVNDISKILINNTLGIAAYTTNWPIDNKLQLRNAASLYGSSLDTVLNNVIYELKKTLVVFEVVASDNDVSMALSDTQILTCQYFDINFTCYTDNTMKCYSDMNKYKSILLSERCRLAFQDDGIFIKKCSNLNVVNEFINSKLWSTVRFTLTIAANIITEMIADEDYATISDITIKKED